MSIHTVGAGAPHDSEGGAAGGSWGQTSTAGVDSVQQSGESEDPGVENDSQEKPGEALHISGWQRRLQSAVPQHELHQVQSPRWFVVWSEVIAAFWAIVVSLSTSHLCSTVSYSKGALKGK